MKFDLLNKKKKLLAYAIATSLSIPVLSSCGTNYFDYKVEDVKIVGNFIKGDIISKKDKLIKGAKTLRSSFKNRVNSVRSYVKDKTDDAKEWVEDKVDDVKTTGRFIRSAVEVKKDEIKQDIKETKQEIVTESKAKAEEFISNAQLATARFNQRKNKTLLGAVRGVKSIAKALEGKLEDRILSDNEKVEKAQAKQPQKSQKKEMGMEM